MKTNTARYWTAIAMTVLLAYPACLDIDIVFTQFETPAQVVAGQAFNINYAVRNVGADGFTGNIEAYLSRDRSYSADDVLLRKDSADFKPNLNIKLGGPTIVPTAVLSGDYFIISKTGTDKVANKVNVKGANNNGIDLSLLNMDLSVSSKNIQANFDLHNGGMQASGTFGAHFFLSNDPVKSNDDTSIKTETIASIPGLSQTSHSISIVPPPPSENNNYTLFVCIDALNQVNELNENNNLLSYRVSIPIEKPNLVAQKLDAPFAMEPGGNYYVSVSIVNSGQIPTGKFFYRYWLSKDQKLEPSIDIPMSNFQSGGLGSGVQTTKNDYLGIPDNTPKGPYYLIVELNPTGSAKEHATSDNTASARVFIGQCFNLLADNPAEALAQNADARATAPESDPQAISIDALRREILSELKVYPNPAALQTALSFYIGGVETARLDISDWQGRVVQTMQIPVSEGFNTSSVDLSGLPKGVYAFRLRAGDKQISRKVLVSDQ